MMLERYTYDESRRCKTFVKKNIVKDHTDSSCDVTFAIVENNLPHLNALSTAKMSPLKTCNSNKNICFLSPFPMIYGRAHKRSDTIRGCFGQADNKAGK